MLFGSCSVTRHIEPQESLLVKTKFNGVRDNQLKEGLNENNRLKPNRKILGVYPLYLQAWNFGKDGRDSASIRRFFREKIGEEPVLFDSSKLEPAKKQLLLYLFNSGYFNAQIEAQVRVKRRKTKVNYFITLNKPYSINEISYKIYDKDVFLAIIKDSANRLFKTGEVFNTEKLSDERDRLSAYLKNNGYFHFNKEYIAFEVDSNLNRHQVNLAIECKNPTTFGDHHPFTINRVMVDIRYAYFLPGVDDSSFRNYDDIWIKTNGFPIAPAVLAKTITIKPGQLYRENVFQLQYNRIFELSIFKTINVSFLTDSSNHLLDVYIILEPEEKHDFSIEPQVITSDQASGIQNFDRRIWGLSGQFSYRNKNTFKGAELLDIRVGSSAEFQFSNSKFIFSNLEQSISSSITFPKWLGLNSVSVLDKLDKITPWQYQKTTLNLTFFYENNLDFVQRTALLSYAYAANRKYSRYRVVPFEINLNQVNFKRDIGELGVGQQLLLVTLLTPNFIPTSRFEWYKSAPFIKRPRNKYSVRSMIEFGGNSWAGAMALFNAATDTNGNYQLFNSALFQFTRVDFEYRYLQNPDKANRFAHKVRFGAGLPYGNSSIIPFEKRFFIGGANSLRGWRPRGIGPGTYSSAVATQIDRSGELVIEGSSEFRFNMIDRFLEGALFVDAGNIWNIKADTALRGAEFNLAKFHRQLAINTGVGFRFDFSFFIIRLDVGMQLRDPAFSVNNGWVINDRNYLARRSTLNFGIGYPF